MAHLLHIDSSIQGVAPSAASSPPAPATPGSPRTPKAPSPTEELISEIKAADTIVLGLPLCNFGAPSSVKAWVDHLIAPGLSIDAQTKALF